MSTSPSALTDRAPLPPPSPAGSTRDFNLLVGAQFFGAFNDNLFKQLILFLAANLLFPGEDKQGLAFAVFALPFVVFSGIAGDLSERFSKSRIVLIAKVAEIVIMVAGVIAFATVSWIGMLGVLFIMGVQSAFFGPPKYGIIPELVKSERILGANGTIAMTTFLSVLTGQALAGPLLDHFGDHLWVPGIACVAFAVIGTAFAWRMSPLPPVRPDLSLRRVAGVPNPFGRLGQTIGELRRTEGLFPMVMLYSLFWFNGGVLQQAIVGLGEPEFLDIGLGEKSLLSGVLITLALSIMGGSVVAPRLAKRFRVCHLVRFGATAMFLGQCALLLVGPVLTREQGALPLTHVLLAIIGFCGALFVVPLQTHFQVAPPPGQRGQTWAVNNFMNFIFIFLGGVYYLLARLPSMDIGPAWAQAAAALLLFGAVVSQSKHIDRLGTGHAGRPAST